MIGERPVREGEFQEDCAIFFYLLWVRWSLWVISEELDVSVGNGLGIWSLRKKELNGLIRRDWW